MPPAASLLVSAGTRGARLKAAAATARAPWLLFLRPGIVPDVTWVDETRRFMAEAELHGRAGSRAAVFRPGLGTSRPLLVEALSLLRRALGARPNADQGLLIGKTLYEEVGGHREDAAEPERDLARRLGRRRIATLRSGVCGHRPAAGHYLTLSINSLTMSYTAFSPP